MLHLFDSLESFRGATAMPYGRQRELRGVEDEVCRSAIQDRRANRSVAARANSRPRRKSSRAPRSRFAEIRRTEATRISAASSADSGAEDIAGNLRPAPRRSLRRLNGIVDVRKGDVGWLAWAHRNGRIPAQVRVAHSRRHFQRTEPIAPRWHALQNALPFYVRSARALRGTSTVPVLPCAAECPARSWLVAGSTA